MPTDTAGWVPPTDKDADPRLLLDAQDMVIRDRNSPSVVVWSLCNELGCVAGDPNGNDFDIISPLFPSLVPTNAVTAVPCRVVYITLPDASC